MANYYFMAVESIQGCIKLQVLDPLISSYFFDLLREVMQFHTAMENSITVINGRINLVY